MRFFEYPIIVKNVISSPRLFFLFQRPIRNFLCGHKKPSATICNQISKVSFVLGEGRVVRAEKTRRSWLEMKSPDAGLLENEKQLRGERCFSVGSRDDKVGFGFLIEPTLTSLCTAHAFRWNFRLQSFWEIAFVGEFLRIIMG